MGQLLLMIRFLLRTGIKDNLNFGKRWVSFKDLLEEKYCKWKYENFELYDEEGNEMIEGLEEELDELFYNFLRDTSHEKYFAKLLKILE